MNPTKIPKFNKEQTKQLIKDLNHKPTESELAFWRDALEDAKKIKVE